MGAARHRIFRYAFSRSETAADKVIAAIAWRRDDQAAAIQVSDRRNIRCQASYLIGCLHQGEIV